jgi:16S rRNA processing protein RimM
MADWDALVTVGRIARPHGLRGHVVVNLETDFPEERFRVGERVWVRRTSEVEVLRIEEARFHQGRPVVRFAGVATVEQAEALGRGDLRVDPADLPPLPEQTFRHSDLIGCTVWTAGGQEVGTVVRVDGNMATSRLVVGGRGRDVMVPLAEAICVRIDVAQRRIVIEPPEGLLDL